MTDIEYNVQPIYNDNTNRMQYNGDYNDIKIKNMPTFSHVSSVIIDKKSIIKFGRTDAVGVVGLGEKEFMYKFDDFRHCFYDGDDACRSRCDGELSNSDATFKDFKAPITKTVIGVKPTFSVKTNNKKDEDVVPEPKVEVEPEDDLAVDSLFTNTNDPDW
jgi:hypothetical protein